MTNAKVLHVMYRRIYEYTRDNNTDLDLNK